jgi:hypothetical protein
MRAAGQASGRPSGLGRLGSAVGARPLGLGRRGSAAGEGPGWIQGRPRFWIFSGEPGCCRVEVDQGAGRVNSSALEKALAESRVGLDLGFSA